MTKPQTPLSTRARTMTMIQALFLLCAGAIVAYAAGGGWAKTITCPGTYGGHLQGIAIDEQGNHYWSFTVAVVKTDPEGNLLKKVDAPSHHGGMTVHDGKVYVAVNLGKFNEEAGNADSWVYVYDASTLKLLAKHPVPELVHGAGGMAYRNGQFIIIGGLPTARTENYVYVYDEKFHFVERFELPTGYTTYGIQTVCFHAGYWWFGCYGDKLIKATPKFKLVKVYDQNGAWGMVGAVPDPNGNRLWVGRSFDRWRGSIVPAVVNDNGSLTIYE